MPTEQSYSFVAQVLNAHGLWTEGCNGFFTRSGFKQIGLESLESKLRKAGYTGGELMLQELNLDDAAGWILILFDSSRMKDCVTDWVADARTHYLAFHSGDANVAQRPRCI